MERTRYLRASDPYELHADGGMLERVTVLPAGECSHCGLRHSVLYRCARLGEQRVLCANCRGLTDRELWRAARRRVRK